MLDAGCWMLDAGCWMLVIKLKIARYQKTMQIFFHFFLS
jgi:hypothetical protein